MVAKGYTTVQLVDEELGGILVSDAALIAQANALIEAAEVWIDRQTGRAWSVTSPITDELHTLNGPVVYLNNKPVTSVTSVSYRALSIGASDTVLVAGTGYELIDAANGVLLLATFPPFYDWVTTEGVPMGGLLKVTYTSSTPVPADIQRAATLVVAGYMQARQNSDMRGVQSYAVGSSGDTFNVTFRDADAPSEVMQILRAREAIVFA